ncbi:MAG: DNA primase, partial [Bacteroidales bacterium]|nr:DNA primase [Bacteroidales bacterium]
MIDRATIDKIIDASDITEVIGDFVSLKKRGVNYLACCPFHNEKTPSFSVSAAKGIYKCFGCGKAGNAVSFVMEHEHLTYVEALKYLGKKYGIEIKEKELTAEEIQAGTKRESLMIVSAYAQDYFSKTLWEHPDGKNIALSYFRERGFSDKTIKKFQLGYCLDSRSAFSNTAIKDGYKKEYLVGVGLSIEREEDLFDRFYGRVLFPIHSISGRVIAFGARTLKQDKNIAKYLNSPESEIYIKSNVLYGIYFAKQAIVRSQKCYLVEGYTDVISMHQAGVENVVASSGTSLTTEQIRLIKRFAPNVTVLYDSDAAGIKASLRGIDMLLEEG